MNKKQIIFVSTIHRMSERVISAILRLSDEYDITLIRLGQASKNTKYSAKGNYERLIENNSGVFRAIIDSVSISSYSPLACPQYVTDIKSMFANIDLKDTVCVILDDSRGKAGEKILYDRCKKLKIPVVANSHGNVSYETIKRSLSIDNNGAFDALFVFGKHDKNLISSYPKRLLVGGIPSNDELKTLVGTKPQYILVITNFLMDNQISKIESKAAYAFNRQVLLKMQLDKLQDHFKLPILFKIKPRISTSLVNEIAVLKRNIPLGLYCMIAVNFENEDINLSQSACVLTYGSTMAFKPIQLGIPTIIFKELGYVGNFQNYPLTVSINDDYFSRLNSLTDEDRKLFLDDTIEGGYTFSSTEMYIKELKDFINEYNSSS